MANKLTAKQEKFCQEYILNGGNASAAYRVAYNCKNWKEKSVNEKASQILKNVKIESRLKEQSKKIQKKFEYTVEQSFKELEQVKELALKKDVDGKLNLTAANKAIELKGKLLGLYTEKHSIGFEKPPQIIDDL